MTPQQRKHFEFVRDEMHGEPEQEQRVLVDEPVARKATYDVVPLCTKHRAQQPLTEAEFERLHHEKFGYVVTGLMGIVRLVEAAHGITDGGAA